MVKIIDTSPKAKRLDNSFIEKAFGVKPAGSPKGLDLFSVQQAMTALLQKATTKLSAYWKKDEIKFLVCKKCGCVIDCGMCSYDCPEDSKRTSERCEEDMEYRIFTFTRTEPYVREPEPEIEDE